MPALAPLLPREGLEPEALRILHYLTDLYQMAMLEQKRPAGRLYRDDEIVTFIFASHRLGSALTAQAGLAAENRLFGSDFDIDGLHRRATKYTLVTEFAAMCARWSRGNAELTSACAMVSSSLRTAFWLWLEDDDRAMALLRCTLEQIARVKVWHTKREKAQRLETNPATTPRDWIVEAEYSPTIGFTARRLFAEHIGIEMTPGDRSLDKILDHIWQYRSHPLIQTPYPITRIESHDSQDHSAHG